MKPHTLEEIEKLSAGRTDGLWTTNHLRIEHEAEHGVVNDGWIIAQTFGPDADANAVFISFAPRLLQIAVEQRARLYELSPANKELEIYREWEKCARSRTFVRVDELSRLQELDALRKSTVDSWSVCEWTPVEKDDDENWSTGCGTEWILLHGRPSENDMSFCPKCGRKLVVKEVSGD